ncbi:hypothetical protein [Sphingopyxis macrogoltabida]|nr:hypothetical protein [Sphingopyxis macrogoltabida]
MPNEEITENVLREFIRYSIAPWPYLAKKLDQRNLREHWRFEAQSVVNGKRFGESRKWKDRRTELYQNLIKRVVNDISRYRSWSPSRTDWISLWVASSGQVSFNYKPKARRPKAEADHVRDKWYNHYLETIDEETGRPHSTRQAARKAANRINRMIGAGVYPAEYALKPESLKAGACERKRAIRSREIAEANSQADKYVAKAEWFRAMADRASSARAKHLRRAADKWAQHAENLRGKPVFVEAEWWEMPPDLDEALRLQEALEGFSQRFAIAVASCEMMSEPSE